MASTRLISVDFEVFGKVQGVFFRVNTQKTAKAHKLVGWVRNTARGTVEGQVQGPAQDIQTMKHWLQKIGSKKSRIDKCEFKNEKTVGKCDFTDFEVKKIVTCNISSDQ